MVPDRSAADPRTRLLQRIALGAYALLIALTLVWEGWLAPKGPPGLWLMIKSLPLLVPFFGLLRGRLRSYLHASLLLLLYLTEGLVILWTEATGAASGVRLALAGAETVLTSLFFGCATYYVRRRRAEGASLRD